MFNVNEMDRRGKEYMDNRMHQAEHENLVQITRGYQAGLVQRYLNFVLELWQNKAHRGVSRAVSPCKTATLLAPKRSA